MKRLSLHNRRWTALLLTVAFAMMSVTTQASWQCLDGHPCPPGCTMQQGAVAPHATAPRACCAAKQAGHGTGASACSMCATASPIHAGNAESCTSPICVKRIKAKPHIATLAHTDFLFDFGSPAILLPAPTSALAPEVIALLASSPPRAPPGQPVVAHHSPRAPPALL